MRRLLSLITLMATPAMAGERGPAPDWVQNTKLSGVMYADAYFMAANHDAEIEGANGFWFRRIDLTFDTRISETFSSRLRFEVESPGDFETSAAFEPFIKSAWLNWQRGDHNVMFGLLGTPTWHTVEKDWGYRSVEKPPLDLQKLGNSRDIGIGLSGTLSEQKLFYRLMLGNGAGRKDETNEGKKIYGSLGLRPTESWVAELYADFEDRPGDSDRRTLQGYVGYRTERGRFGALVARQTREVEGEADLELTLVSAFGALKAGDRFGLLARIDRMDEPNPDGARIAYLPFEPSAASTLLVLGVDVALHDRVSLIPNLEYVFYDDSAETGDTPGDDLMLRMTMAWKF